MKESPLFLLSKRKLEEFKHIIKHIAKVNKKKLDDDFDEFIES